MTVFVPYVYGATLGVPSAGRPQRVLDAGLAPETAARRFERELDLNPVPLARGGAHASAPCGTVAAYRRHYRNGEPACQPCKDANTARSTRQKRLARARKAAS